MKFKSPRIPPKKGKILDINKFNKEAPYPDLLKLSEFEVRMLVQIRNNKSKRQQ